MKFSIEKMYFTEGSEESCPADESKKIRRRNSSLCNVTMNAAHNLMGVDWKLPVVFSSRYGEWQQALKLMKQLFYDNGLSPAGFSKSVHNSSVGLLSILNKNSENYTAISASEMSFEMGLIESLTIRPRKILYLCSEEQAPDFFKEVTNDNMHNEALAMCISKDLSEDENNIFEISFSKNNCTARNASEFVKFINSTEKTFVANSFVVKKIK